MPTPTSTSTSSSTFYDRLRAEHAELDERHQKLDQFIYHSNVFDSLASEDKVLMRIQSSIMGIYKEILQQRFIRLDQPAKGPDETRKTGVKVILRETQPESIPIRATCQHCWSELEFLKSEARLRTDRNGRFREVTCPVCKGLVTKDCR